MTATLALADGRIFRGRAFGAEGRVGAEVVFNTSMSGYLEILTDPSYDGQIVVMTCPEIGNVGVNVEDLEGFEPRVRGLVVKEYWRRPSNWRSTSSLGEFMESHGIIGIEAVDTRALVRHIRDLGAQQAILATGDCDEEELVREAAATPGLEGQDLASDVTTAQAYRWETGEWVLGRGHETRRCDGPLLAVFDFGVKLNILRNFVNLGCRLAVIPSGSDAEYVRTLGPDGLFLSNGPGDPDAVTGAIEVVGQLLGDYPTFGICLGHQILALALGGRTFKMKFGHHGGNQPVMDLETGVVEITSQNHGFSVDPDSLPAELRVSHLNLNDQTVEGLAHRELPIFSVQYHPEASPGPHDANPLFRKFVAGLKAGRGSPGAAGLPLRAVSERRAP
ncbi:MAG: glutamine-hydrolyzing carbamoyl-phosphate synthase small subunit [Candidatus Binatia bacterium]